MGEPLSPWGRFFALPEVHHIINCPIGFKNPVDAVAIKREISKPDCVLFKHPRCSSLLKVDKNGREFWRKTRLNLDDHIIVHNIDCDSEEEKEEKINAFLADIAVSSPLSLDKPLWEIHVMSGLNCFVLRFHHALGDGISLMSMFLSSCKRIGHDEYYVVGKEVNIREKERKGTISGLWRILKMIWFTIIFVIEYMGRSLCMIVDKKTLIRGGEGVELWPRMISTAKFSLEDMKIVKRAIPNSTINDVLFGVISYGFSRYLNTRSSSHALQKAIRITGVSMVNLRRQSGLQEMSKLMKGDSRVKWGNQFGFMILPIYCHTKDVNPLSYVKRAKAMTDQKKQSLEAHFSVTMRNFLMSLFGPKAASMHTYKIICNSTFTISNVVGPTEELTFAGNPISYVKATSSSLAHAITMHMVSYAGTAYMQVLVARDIIPDPQYLAKCFEDALVEMKNTARSITD